MKKFSRSIVFQLLSIAALVLFTGCSQNAKLLGSSILSSTGLVSNSQANTMFEAGEGFYKAAQTFTPEEEYYLGRGVSASVLTKYQPLRNPALNQYITKVGRTLAAVSDRPETFAGYHFQVLDSDEINAFAAPSGFIFVTKGFMKLLPSEDALAGVLAHEIGHIVAEDGIKAISRGNLTNAFTALGKQALDDTISHHAGADVGALSTAFSGSIKDMTNTLIVNGYSRSQEYAADAYAASLVKKAGYNPAAILVVMERLKAMKAEGGVFETHPAPDDRIEEITAIVAKEPQTAEGEELRTKRFQKTVQGAGIRGAA